MHVKNSMGAAKTYGKAFGAEMTFNVFEMGTEDSVRRAFDVLHDGGVVVIEVIHELLWSKCCATVIALCN